MDFFDKRPMESAALACINDQQFQVQETYAIDVSTTTASLTIGTTAIYRVFLEGMDATKTVALTVTADPDTVVIPSSGTPGVVAVFPGNVVERLRVSGAGQTVNARLSSGTGTLFLVPVFSFA